MSMRARLVIVSVFLLLSSMSLPGHAKVTIEFWHQFSGGTPKEAIDTLVEQFNATHKDIHVNAIAVPQYRDNVQTAIVGGTPPDVVYNLEAATYGRSGMLMSLSPFVARDALDLDMYFPLAIEESTFRGNLYGLPIFLAIHPMIAYRVDAFESVGLDPADPPKSWQELHAAGRRLTDRVSHDRVARIGFEWTSGASPSAFHVYYRLAGGSITDKDGDAVVFNNSTAVMVMEWLAQVQHETAQELADWTGGDFIDGARAIQVIGQWEPTTWADSVPDFRPYDDYRIAAFPPPEQFPLRVTASGRNIGIPYGAKHPDEAWEFIKWLTSEAPARTWGLIRGLPPGNMLGARGDEYSDIPFWNESVELLVNHGFPEYDFTPNRQRVLAALSDAYTAVVEQTTSPSAAIEDAARVIEAIVRE